MAFKQTLKPEKLEFKGFQIFTFLSERLKFIEIYWNCYYFITFVIVATVLALKTYMYIKYLMNLKNPEKPTNLKTFFSNT